jgi:plastocyanin
MTWALGSGVLFLGTAFWAFDGNERCLAKTLRVSCCATSAAAEGSAEERLEEASSPVTPAPAPRADEVGTVKGAVAFEGAAPERASLEMGADPVCVKSHSERVLAEDVVVNKNGTLRNVLLVIKKGPALEGYKGEAPKEEVLLDQRGCVYIPHVLALRAGQTLRVKSSDATLHNIHTLPRKNTQMNKAMPSGSPDLTTSFKTAELSIDVKCDVHPWMRAVAHVVKHPFFALTGDEGEFSIANLTPGDYTIDAIHEKLGTQTSEVKIEAGKTRELKLTFRPK